MSLRKSNQDINCTIKDWNGKDVLLPQSVIDYHIIDSNHQDALNYVGELQQGLNLPENVVASKSRNNTQIANIKLNGKKHPYLQVVIRYGTFFSKILGKKNFIVSFYGSYTTKKGKIIWQK